MKVVYAALGGVAVGWVFWVTRRFVCQLLCPWPSACTPEAYAVEEEAEGEGEGDGQPNARLATTGALISALTFACCTRHGWSGTMAFEYSVDTLLMLVLVEALLNCYGTERRGRCELAMAVCGVCIAESPFFLVLLPAVFLFILRLVVRGEITSEHAVPRYLLAGIAGYVLNLGAGVTVWSLKTKGSLQGFDQGLQIFLREQWGKMIQGVHPDEWLLVWIVPVLLLVIAMLCLRLLVTRDEYPGFDGYLMIVACLLVIFANLLTLPFSALSIARRLEYLAVYPALMVAFAAGIMTVALQLLTPRPQRD